MKDPIRVVAVALLAGATGCCTYPANTTSAAFRDLANQGRDGTVALETCLADPVANSALCDEAKAKLASITTEADARADVGGPESEGGDE